MMRALWISSAALALSACSASYGGADTPPVASAPAPAPAPVAAPASIPAVTQSMPEQMASMDPSDSLLFWSDERRSAAFRDMESLFPGLEVAPATSPRCGSS